jgi:hypothetical protein
MIKLAQSEITVENYSSSAYMISSILYMTCNQFENDRIYG